MVTAGPYRRGVVRPRRAEGLPTIYELMWLSVQALRDLGGQARLPDLDQAVARLGALTAEQLSVQRGSRPQSEVTYRTRWALTHLKALGIAANDRPGAGKWRLTAKGRRVDRDQLVIIRREGNAAHARERNRRVRAT
jgi:hypothetical protein